MIDTSLAIVSTVAGLWNVLHEKFVNLRRAICMFILGFSFCYGVATLANTYGLASEAAAAVGYLAGITSSTIYDVVVRCLLKVPNIFEKRLTNRK